MIICNQLIVSDYKHNVYECPHIAKLAKFKPSRCLNIMSWNSLCMS